MTGVEALRTDVLVLGGGVAGLTAAIALEPLDVLVVQASGLREGTSTSLAMGGIAAALGPDDSPVLHAQDTESVGGGLVDPELAEVLAREAPGAIAWLESLGARFDRTPEGAFALGREAGHSRARIVHARGDATGQEVARTLAARAGRAAWISVWVGTRAVALLRTREGRVTGALLEAAGGQRIAVRARAVVLATGGIGQIYRWTTNPTGAWGSGWFLAAQAGAALADCEFVQFHPTALASERIDPVPLLTEALRGAGAVLVDERGHRFVFDEDARGELAPRDLVARAVARVWRRGGRAYLDAREAVGRSFPERFPTVWAACRRVGIDPRDEPIPCMPAAHYAMGGVAVDAWGRTDVPGLYACGEVAASGVHGANRLASNSLLEGLVFGRRVAEAVREELEPRRNAGAIATWVPAGLEDGAGEHGLVERLRRRAWDSIGLLRNGPDLDRFRRELEELWPRVRHSWELSGRVVVASAIAAAASARRESRGAHFRSDVPEASSGTLQRWRVRVRASGDGLELEVEALDPCSARPEARLWAGSPA